MPFACGSMVLAILSVFRFLRSASAKTGCPLGEQKKMKYRCERSHLGYSIAGTLRATSV
jgi:hypothetical protein